MVKYLGTTVDTRTYDDGGRLGTSTYANAAVVSFAYRNDNLPTSIATTHAGSPNIGTYSYTWDANKNKTGETITSTMSGFGFSTGASGYDDEDRLQAWNRTNGTMNQAWTLSDVGNWDAFTSAGSTWNRTHSNAHEFTGFTGASTGTLAYDVKGNQTSRPSTLSAPALNLDWNFDNQLVGADTNGSAGSLEVTFEYDALGRRVSRSHSSGNVVYVHAGQQVIADYARGTAAASPSYRYVYADYVDEPILRHTGTGTTLPTTGDNTLYYHRNQQYSIIGLTNAAGTLVERYSYTAYGTLGIYDASGTVRTSSTYANRYTYTGREYDADLNLYHFRARWYDPATGGFISRDPLGYVDGMSLHRGYLGVRDIDPFGDLVVRGFDEPLPDRWGVEQHHWFPQKHQSKIESLCSKVGFSIHAYTTKLQIASYFDEETGKRGMSKVYSDHTWLEKWRKPTWEEEVSLLLGEPGTTCCSFLTAMIERIRAAYKELRDRELARGVPEWEGHYEDPIQCNMFPWTSDMLLVQGRGAFDKKGWHYFSTWSILLNQRARACQEEENDLHRWVHMPCREQVLKERVPEHLAPLPPGGHGLIEDPIIMEAVFGLGGIVRKSFVRLIWRPTVRPGLPPSSAPPVSPTPRVPPVGRPGWTPQYVPPTIAG
ncbi:MAG: RHS repeat-associated core domain-containing protein [Planctomycetaceae bacterium]|nr:RHS repeat-associated core domain-containing protein [Planctomycetaceae bacterium]